MNIQHINIVRIFYRLLPAQQQTHRFTSLTQTTNYNVQVRVTSESGKIVTANKNATTKTLAAPTYKETGTKNKTVTITFPEGCGSTYTCTYVKDGGRSQAVTSTNQELVYNGDGTLTATVQEEDGTAHTTTVDIPLTNSAE